MNKLFFLFLSVLFISCSSSDSKEDTLSKNSYAISVDEHVKLNGDKELKIDNQFVASFKDGELIGKHIGETTGVYNGIQSINISVKGTIKYVEYPVTEWGISANDVKNKHYGGSLDDSSSEKSILYSITSGSRRKYEYLYSFDNGKLTACAFLAPYTDAEILASWLLEKYMMFPTNDDTIFSGGYDALTMDEATTIIAMTSHKMNTNNYVSAYAYMTVFTGKNYVSRSISMEEKQIIIEQCKKHFEDLGLIE